MAVKQAPSITSFLWPRTGRAKGLGTGGCLCRRHCLLERPSQILGAALEGSYALELQEGLNPTQNQGQFLTCPMGWELEAEGTRSMQINKGMQSFLHTSLH